MKRTLKLTLPLLLILAVLSALMLTGCKGNTEITDAYITNSNLPRTTYVVGQELDLSKGYLTVVRGGEETNIPLSAEGVSVSGYNSNTLGEQTVTVSYNTASATFTVKVIPRISAENFETKYFVGDSFNKAKGRLRVADDTGKTLTVNFNDARVSLVSFDSKTAGTKTITVKYKSGSTSYECSFDVTVYEAANIEYHAPKKNSYDSHKTVIEDKDVKDGYFNVTSSDGKLTKVVPITADMIKGYDPSLANIENRDNGFEQTLKIEYLGVSYDYKIKIFFSGISIVNYYANGILKNLNLSGSLSNAENAASFDAICALLDLSPAERASIPTENLNTVIAAAAVGVTDLFMKELDNFKFAFGMDETGSLGLVGTNYEVTKTALTALQDPESNINLYVKVLRTLLADYSKATVTETEKVSDIVIVYSVEMENLLVPALLHLVTVHEHLDNIPDVWTLDILKENSVHIIEAALEIKRSEYHKNGLGAFYSDVLINWREKKDFIDIIYNFFLYAYDGEESYMQNNLFGYLPMPPLLEDVYEQMLATYNMQVTLYQGQNDSTWMADLSTYATSYFLTFDLAERVKSSGDQFLMDIYNKYNMDYVLSSYLGAQNFGFNYHAAAMIDSDIFHTIWGQYYAVLQLYLTKKLDANNPAHVQLVTSMFDTLQEMNPNELFGFLSSLNLGYGDSRGAYSILRLEFETFEEANYFTKVLREYYYPLLSDHNKSVFNDMLQAMECAALFGESDAVLEYFVSFMGNVKTFYNKMVDEKDTANLDNFNKYLGKSYEKYVAIYNRIIGEYTDKPTEKELELISQLRLDIARFEEILNLLLSIPDADYTEAHDILLFSAFAKAKVTYNKIVSTASDAALTVLFTDGFTFMQIEETLGKAFYQLERDTTLMMQFAGVFQRDGKYFVISHRDALGDYGLLSIYAGMSDLLYYALTGALELSDAEALLALENEINLLDEFSANLFNYFGGASAYYAAKCKYLKDTVTDTAALGVLSALERAANAFADYRMNSGNNEYVTEITTAMSEATAAYTALDAELKDSLKEVYDFYLEISEAFNEQA